MADQQAYKVIKDVSLPRQVSGVPVDVLPDGTEVYATEGRTYAEGDFVLSEELTNRDAERAKNGELDQFLEPVSDADYEEVRAQIYALRQYHSRVPEHEAEATIAEQYGHEVRSRQERMEANSAGAEAAKEALEAAKEDGNDERPGLTSPPTPDLALASREGLTINADHDGERKSSPRRAPRKQKDKTPSGAPVGEDKEAGEGE